MGTDTDAGMDGGLTVEICDTDLTCCNAGMLDSFGNDFQSGFVDVFYGSAIGECDNIDIGEGAAIMVVTHQGIDAWLGEWIRLLVIYHRRKKKKIFAVNCQFGF